MVLLRLRVTAVPAAAAALAPATEVLLLQLLPLQFHSNHAWYALTWTLLIGSPRQRLATVDMPIAMVPGNKRKAQVTWRREEQQQRRQTAPPALSSLPRAPPVLHSWWHPSVSSCPLPSPPPPPPPPVRTSSRVPRASPPPPH
eukprot:TRINITY_DN11787_c0_g2_i1.p5 TRINITY_DN11787_c0_g2~~TRINITY_DN11787_c0_g2_i1.p5  ORF type:complete len:143 (+),score=6.08 TRINITY_DN11787_c0_g2_i1:52-480(+)